jgi:hypothetical protein
VRHWLISVEMVVVLFIVTILASLGITIAAALLAIPFLLLFLAAAVLKSAVLLAVVATIGALTLIALIVLAGSLLSTFTYAAWTLLYLRIGERSAVAKLTRWSRTLGLHRRIA